MKRKEIKTTLFLTRGALISALYIALTYLSSIFGLSSGVIQFRISEALCILPIFLPEAIPGLFIGCIISNFIAGGLLWDIIFGSLATLIGCVCVRLFKNFPYRLMWLATLPTVFSNAVIIPFVLMYVYGAEGSYFFFMLTVAIGEIVCAGVGGSLLYYSLKKTNFL